MVVRMLWIRIIRDSGYSAVSALNWANSPVSKSLLKKLPLYLCKLLSVYNVTYNKWKFLLSHVSLAMCCIALHFNSSLISCPRNYKFDPDRSLISVWNWIFRFHPMASLQKCTVITGSWYLEQWRISFPRSRTVQVLFKVCLKVKLKIIRKMSLDLPHSLWKSPLK